MGQGIVRISKWIAIALALGAAFAQAQAPQSSYPSKVVRIVVPVAAGGGVDTVARALGNHLAETLGQPVIVENRSGANTIIGTDFVAKSAPDGYTLLLNTGPPHGAFNFFTKNLPFDPIADFTPITMVGTAAQALVVHPSLPVGSVKELIDYAKKNPGKLSFGTSGAGTSQHLGGALLNRMAGIDIEHVAYKGGAQALNDVLGGQIPVAMLILSNVQTHVRSGKLRLGRAKTIPLAQKPTLVVQRGAVLRVDLQGTRKAVFGQPVFTHGAVNQRTQVIGLAQGRVDLQRQLDLVQRGFQLATAEIGAGQLHAHTGTAVSVGAVGRGGDGVGLVGRQCTGAARATGTGADGDHGNQQTQQRPNPAPTQALRHGEP